MQLVAEYTKLINAISIPNFQTNPTLDIDRLKSLCCWLCLLSYRCSTKEDLVNFFIKNNIPLVQVKWVHSSHIDTSNPLFVKIDCPDLIYLVFRGSTTVRDHIMNVLTGTFNKGVHTSWMMESISIALENNGKLLRDCSNSRKPILCTGHSKGGLIATYICMIFHFFMEILIGESNYTNAHSVLFGTPSIFPKEYTEYFKRLILHVANHNDILAHITGGEKCGTFTTNHIGSSDISIFKMTNAHSIEEYSRET